MLKSKKLCEFLLARSRFYSCCFLETNPNIKDSDREDLPPGWAVRYDEKTKRVYYVDHVNKKTQWQKPGTQVARFKFRNESLALLARV